MHLRAQILRHTRDVGGTFVVATWYTFPHNLPLHTLMVLLRLDENFNAPKFYNRIAEVEDNLLFYDKFALPVIPKAFNSVVITECLHATEKSSVYSGYFEDREGKRYEEYDVAFKFADDEQSCHEAEKYDKLFRLQGKAIPHLLGLAFAKRIKGGYMGCLMTEKFGSSLDCKLISLARSEKYVVVFSGHYFSHFSSGLSSSITFNLCTTRA